MRQITAGLKNKILAAALILLIILFAFSVFKNISYPLLWNDEAETAMFATRILEYGYPKVHDGKNTVYLLSPIIELGVKEKVDAYIGTAWGQYYFCAIGAFFARKIDDIYVKTAVLRAPFAAVGFAGLIITGLSVIGLFKNDSSAKLLFLIFYFFFELLSIPVALHLRQVRVYPLIFFLFALSFYVYIHHRLFKKIGTAVYIPVMTLLLLLLFNTFSPCYFIFIAFIFLYESLVFINKKSASGFASGVTPVFISFVAAIPLFVFFETFQIADSFSKLFNISLGMLLPRILYIVGFFRKYAFLDLVFFAKSVALVLYAYLRKNEKAALVRPKLSVSNLLFLFCVVYIIAIPKIPITLLFQRYFIMLHPLLIVILLLDLFAVYELASLLSPLKLKKRIAAVISVSLCLLFALDGTTGVKDIKNYVYELSHQYRGVLDFAIPYIKSNYGKPEDLVIATNYEETAYMYYLGSKVIIGFMRNDLKNDLKETPDIIIFRRGWELPQLQNAKILNFLLKKARYDRISFPVFDYPVNNSPEIVGPLPHLYKTKIAENEKNHLEIYIKR